MKRYSDAYLSMCEFVTDLRTFLLSQAFAYLIPEELFKMELEEGIERVQISITVLRTFKQLFHTYHQHIPKYYKRSQDIKLWDFPATLVFQRTDRIIERLLMIEVCGAPNITAEQIATLSFNFQQFYK